MTFNNIEEKISYIYGRELAQTLRERAFKGLNINIVKQALMDEFTLTPPPFSKEEAEAIREQFNAQMKAKQEQEQSSYLEMQQRFLADQQQRDAIEEMQGGLLIERIEEGDVSHQGGPKSSYLIEHKTWLISGQLIDSSEGVPDGKAWSLMEMPLSWAIALKQMKLGAHWRLYSPARFAFGEDGNDYVPAGSTIVFEIKLLAVN